MIAIRRSAIAEIESAPNRQELLDEYAEESSIAELGAPKAQFASYLALEATGMMHPICAWDGERLVGLLTILVAVLPHYGVLTATVESFFVPKAERRRGIGLRLLAHAERLARDVGAKGVLLSAPCGGTLAEVMARRKPYRMSNVVFVRAL